jgi:CRP/FNR family transcriptional regulator, cyclic AMP receptor protein
MHQVTSLEARIRLVLGSGPFQRLPAQTVDVIVAAGVVVRVAEGQIQPPWQTSPTVVVDGLMRLRTRTPGGREWTLRYVDAGGTVHFGSIDGLESGLQMQALIDSTLLVIDRAWIRRSMGADPDIAWTVAGACAAELAETVAEVTRTALRPLRTRICNHLLYLSQRGPARDGRVPLTHQDLAGAVGSVRDVATRILDELERAGVVELRRGAIVVRDVPRLEAIRDAWDQSASHPSANRVTSVT